MGGKGPALTPEQARELGRQGGLASQAKRREKAAIRADVRAKAAFANASEEMAKVIIDAAKGTGEFAKLDVKERAQFALKALEYGMGRPRAMDPPTPEAPEGPAGLTFTVPPESKDEPVEDAPAAE